MLHKLKRIFFDVLNLLKKICFYIILIINSIYNKLRKNRKINNLDKKIMILIGKISKGGAERAAVNLAEKLSKNYEVVIVTYDMYDQEKKYIKNVEKYQCNVKHISVSERGFEKIFCIKRLKKENNITHCISFGTCSNFINSITRENEKVIISIRNYLSVSEKSFYLKIKNKISSKLSDYIVSVSKQVEYDQIKNYHINKNKICTIPNYCNREYIQESIKKYDIDDKDKKIFENSRVIITVGKLKEQKGQWHLIRAFKKIVEKNKDVKLIILGTGYLEEYLEKLILDLNLKDNVFLLGHKNKNIYTYMNKSDLFVFPSLFEGMPNVVLEAMECGLPIIATDCYGGNKEIISPSKNIEDEIKDIEKCEYGILIPKLDFNYYNSDEELTKEEIIMANSINEILDDNNLLNYYKEKSLERVKNYDDESYVKEWEKIL